MELFFIGLGVIMFSSIIYWGSVYKCAICKKNFSLLFGKKTCCGVEYTQEDGYASSRKLEDIEVKKIKVKKISMIKIILYTILLGFGLKLIWWIFGADILQIINFIS